jgi:hypothetical protein
MPLYAAAWSGESHFVYQAGLVVAMLSFSKSVSVESQAPYGREQSFYASCFVDKKTARKEG